MKREVFANIKISDNVEATIYEGKGLDLIDAMRKSKGDMCDLIIHLMTRLIKINGKLLTHDKIYELPIKDFSYLNEVISSMMSNEYSKGL